MIDQLLFKPVRAESPILLDIHSKVAGDNHAATIRHETSLIHFTHESVDQRHAGHSLSPPVDGVVACLPVIIGAIVDPIAREDFIAMVEAPVSVEISPEKFINEGACRFVSSLLGFKLLRLPVHFADAEGAIG